MRVALGASHGRLVRNALFESVTLSLIGGAAALVHRPAFVQLHFADAMRPVWIAAITHIFDKKSACTRNGEQDLACPLVRDVRWANNQRRTWPPFCENVDRAYDWLYCSFLWDHREWAT